MIAWPWPKLGITISSNKRPAVLRRLVDHLDAELDIRNGEGSMFDGGMLVGGMCDGIMYDGRMYGGSMYVVASMMVACTI